MTPPPLTARQTALMRQLCSEATHLKHDPNGYRMWDGCIKTQVVFEPNDVHILEAHRLLHVHQLYGGLYPSPQALHEYGDAS